MFLETGQKINCVRGVLRRAKVYKQRFILFGRVRRGYGNVVTRHQAARNARNFAFEASPYKVAFFALYEVIYANVLTLQAVHRALVVVVKHLDS